MWLTHCRPQPQQGYRRAHQESSWRGVSCDRFLPPTLLVTKYKLLSRSSLCARRQGREGGSRSSSAPRRGTGQMAGSAAAGSRRAALSWGPVRCPMIRHRTRLAPCGWLRGTACARAGRKTVSAVQHARAPALRSVCVSKSGGGAREAPPASRAPSRQGFCSRLSLSLVLIRMY